MAKRILQQPRKADVPLIEPDFYHFQNQIMDYLNTLSCAVEALVSSDALDGCEIGGRARNVVRLCEINLHRLMNELERWELNNRGTRKHGAAKAVAHG